MAKYLVEVTALVWIAEEVDAESEEEAWDSVVGENLEGKFAGYDITDTITTPFGD
jgi:hypothetical protein